MLVGGAGRFERTFFWRLFIKRHKNLASGLHPYIVSFIGVNLSINGMSQKQTVDYLLVQSGADMRKALQTIRLFKSLAVDFEMENNYRRYGLHLALIQVSTPERNTYVFDPLSDIDVSPIGELFSDPSIEIVVHDIEFDKRACHQVYGWVFRNIFDTKIAAQFCGYRNFGLAVLLEELIGVQTNKKFQRIDWLKRPIKEDALAYAATETTFLHKVRNILEQKLFETGHIDWAREEFQYHEKVEPVETVEPYLKVRRHSSLAPRQLTILKYLAEFRENMAKKLNRPVQFIIRDKQLVDICHSPPADAASARAIKSMHPAVYQDQNIGEFLNAIKVGLEVPEVRLNNTAHRPGSYAGNRSLKAMQQWRAVFAKTHNIDPYLMLDNEILKWAARESGISTVPPSISAQIKGWQKKLIWPEFANHFHLPAIPE